MKIFTGLNIILSIIINPSKKNERSCSFSILSDSNIQKMNAFFMILKCKKMNSYPIINIPIVISTIFQKHEILHSFCWISFSGMQFC